jgi:hypothetical protein
MEWFLKLVAVLLPVIALGNAGIMAWGWLAHGDAAAGLPFGMGLCVVCLCIVGVAASIAIFQEMQS